MLPSSEEKNVVYFHIFPMPVQGLTIVDLIWLFATVNTIRDEEVLGCELISTFSLKLLRLNSLL